MHPPDSFEFAAKSCIIIIIQKPNKKKSIKVIFVFHPLFKEVCHLLLPKCIHLQHRVNLFNWNEPLYNKMHLLSIGFVYPLYTHTLTHQKINKTSSSFWNVIYKRASVGKFLSQEKKERGHKNPSQS